MGKGIKGGPSFYSSVFSAKLLSYSYISCLLVDAIAYFFLKVRQVYLTSRFHAYFISLFLCVYLACSTFLLNSCQKHLWEITPTITEFKVLTDTKQQIRISGLHYNLDLDLEFWTNLQSQSFFRAELATEHI